MPLNTLPWKKDVSNIPFDKPVLVLKQDNPVPFMAVRNREPEPSCVDLLLGPHASGYGIDVSIEDLEAWLEVL